MVSVSCPLFLLLLFCPPYLTIFLMPSEAAGCEYLFPRTCSKQNLVDRASVDSLCKSNPQRVLNVDHRGKFVARTRRCNTSPTAHRRWTVLSLIRVSRRVTFWHTESFTARMSPPAVHLRSISRSPAGNVYDFALAM